MAGRFVFFLLRLALFVLGMFRLLLGFCFSNYRSLLNFLDLHVNHLDWLLTFYLYVRVDRFSYNSLLLMSRGRRTG
jgi:hypothetical protein